MLALINQHLRVANLQCQAKFGNLDCDLTSTLQLFLNQWGQSHSIWDRLIDNFPSWGRTIRAAAQLQKAKRRRCKTERHPMLKPLPVIGHCSCIARDNVHQTGQM